MKRIMEKNSFFSSIAAAMFFAAVFAVSSVKAAPHDGDEFELEQPDGSTVSVIVWGDEFYQTVQSPDGFTLIRDADGWISYAALSANGEEFVSTGVRYTGPQSTAPFFIERDLRISRESVQRKVRRNKEALGVRDEDHIPRDNRRNRNDGTFAPAPAPDTDDDAFAPAPDEGGEQSLAGAVSGLAVLIDFPNQQSNITNQAMTDFFNRVGGVNGTTASGSVRDWFFDASGGTLDYTNKVTRFFRAVNPKNNYDTGTGYGNVRVLLGEIFAQMKADVETGTDPERNQILCGLSHESGSGTTSSPHVLRATNVYYAGSPAAGWANGLWPHQGTYSGNNRDITIPANRCGPNTAARTVRISRYQLTSLGTGNNPPTIGTTVHENGHMIMRWPDFYNYDSENGNVNVVASYCVMSSSNGGNPQQPNPHLRNLAGWIDVIDITNANQVYTQDLNVAQTAGNPRISMSTTAYYFQRNNNEGYFIEGNRRVGRSSNKPGEGLVIWHLHRSGQNTYANRPNTANPHPLLKVIQSNQPTNTDRAFAQAIGSNANAPFNGTRNAFHSTTAPAAKYYDGTLSAMRITEITNINTSANTISFRVGTSGGTTPATRYAVSFNANGGTGTMSTDSVTQGGNYTIKANTFTRTGHTFTGWRTAATGGTAYAAGAAINNVTANITLFAQWTPNRYAITFNANGGTGTMTADSVNHGASYTIKANTFTRTGHTFTGWRTAASSGTSHAAGAQITNVTGNITLFAQWTPITYTVSFRANGGTGTMTNDNVNHGGSYTIKANTFTRVGHTFNGWRTAATGGTAHAAGATISNVTANITLFAQWTPITYTVSFRANGGAGTMTNDNVNHGGNYTIKANTFTRADHTFAGWNTLADGSGTAYAAGAQITNVTENITLRAQWAAMPVYTITFDPNGGTVTPTTAVTGTNGMLTTLPTPVRSNYTFDGWFTEETAGTEVTAAAVFTVNTTIFARWTALPTYTVTYDANGGMGTIAPDNVVQGNNYIVKANGFIRTGYTFSGWNTAADGSGTNYEIGAQISNVTGNITLYAGWDVTISVLSPDRIIPGPQQPDNDIAPVTVLAGEFTAGPNPAAKQSGAVNFFWQGRRVQSASLSVFDASGNVVVTRIGIKDNAAGAQERRQIGSWDLKDMRGRAVTEGTYLVKGTVTVDGKKERISVIIGVR